MKKSALVMMLLLVVCYSTFAAGPPSVWQIGEVTARTYSVFEPATANAPSYSGYVNIVSTVGGTSGSTVPSNPGQNSIGLVTRPGSTLVYNYISEYLIYQHGINTVNATHVYMDNDAIVYAAMHGSTVTMFYHHAVFYENN